MNWKKLPHKQSGWECDSKEPCLVQDKRFFITHERFKQIVENMHQATRNKIAQS